MVDRKQPADDEERDRPDDEDDARDEPETADDPDSADDGAGSEGSTEQAGEDDDPDGRSAAIGRSLGVVDAEGGDAGEPGSEAAGAGPAAVKNRAARRRERALERRAGRGREAAGDEAADEAGGEEVKAAAKASGGPRETERDRNKRLRDDLLERRRQAAKRATDAAAPATQTGLAASEVAEDVLVRASAATIKWLRRHSALAGWILFGSIVLAAGVVYFIYRGQTTTAAASDLLARAAVADQAMVLPPEEDTRTDEQKADDTRQFFPSADERQKNAIERFDRVIAEHGGTGAAILARLGRAGVLLEQRQWDGAIEAYGAVLDSPLAPVDDDVRARALEGRAFAKEGKGDVDGALAEYQQLEAVAGFKALGLYHRARLLHEQKKQPDEAKKLLVEARGVLEKASVEARAAGNEAPSRWLSRVTEELLRSIDPAALPPKAPSLAPDLSPEQLQRLLGQQGLDLSPGLPDRGTP